MDIGWWDTAHSKLILLELKGIEIWQDFDKSKDTAHDYLVKSIKGKVTDVLLTLSTVWVKTKTGKEIKTSIPSYIHQYQGDGSVKLIFLIDKSVLRKSLLLPIKDAINKELARCVFLA